MLKVASGNNSNPSFEISPRVEKRKIHFNTMDTYLSPEKSCSTSTSDYLSQQGVQWSTLAEVFNCADNGDHTDMMEELLDLCSWQGGNDETTVSNAQIHDDEDEDDDEWMMDLQVHLQKRSSVTTSTSFQHRSQRQLSDLDSSVKLDGLRLDSNIGFKSKPFAVAVRPSLRIKNSSMSSSIVTSCSSSTAGSQSLVIESDPLEDAFQGIMSEDNGIAHHSTIQLTAEEDDFWGEVEF